MDKNEREQMNEIKEQMNRECIQMLPGALDALGDIIDDPSINPIARVQAIALIMDRGMGKPEESIRIRNAEDDMEAAQERLDAIFAKVSQKQE